MRGAVTEVTQETEPAENLLAVRDRSVLTVTLNRPKRKNALAFDMIRGITEAVEAAAQDNRTRVIVLRGAGSDFCSGIDLTESNSPERPGNGDDRSKPRAGHLQTSFMYGA